MKASDESAFDADRESCRNYLTISFYKSWLKCWDEGMYFDNEINPIEHRFLYRDREAIEQIPSYDFFTLFEASILITERTGNSFIGNSIEVFVDAIVNRQLMPRDPDRYLKWIDIPKDQLKGIPDLSWVLSRQELYEFASARFPPSLFADLRDNDPKTTSDRGAKTGVPTFYYLTVERAMKSLLARLGRDPSAREVFDCLQSKSGVMGSGVADVEDGEDGQEKIVFVNANQSLKKPIGYRTIQNMVTKIRKGKK